MARKAKKKPTAKSNKNTVAVAEMSLQTIREACAASREGKIAYAGVEEAALVVQVIQQVDTANEMVADALQNVNDLGGLAVFLDWYMKRSGLYHP